MKRFIGTLLIFSTLFIAACSASVEQNNNTSSKDNNIIFSYPTDNSSMEFDSSLTKPESSENSTTSIDTQSSEASSNEDLSKDVTSDPSSDAPDSNIADSSSPENNSSVSDGNNSSVADVSQVPDISSPDISIDPSTPGATWVNNLRDQQDRDYHGYDPQTLDDYFDDALFVGDSVSNGLKLYTSMYEKIFTDMVFHTGACYGFNNCLSPVSSKSLHPVYQGQQRTIWEMVALTGCKKVFIGFGLNDFGCVTTNNIKKCLDRIISNIRAVNPNVEIIFLSSGYFTKAGESYQPSKNDYRTCFRQRDYNQFVLEYCNSLGLDYIDVSNCFSDEYGYLQADMSMDNYCHPHIKHYHLWRDILYGYAADKINGNYSNPERMR